MEVLAAERVEDRQESARALEEPPRVAARVRFDVRGPAVAVPLQHGRRPQVAGLRCLGAIGVVERRQPVDMAAITRQFVDAGVWVRPFGRLVYLMPAYVISDGELEHLCGAVVDVVARQPG